MRYRGSAKNGNRLFAAAALANLYTSCGPGEHKGVVRPQRRATPADSPGRGSEQAPSEWNLGSRLHAISMMGFVQTSPISGRRERTLALNRGWSLLLGSLLPTWTATAAALFLGEVMGMAVSTTPRASRAGCLSGVIPQVPGIPAETLKQPCTASYARLFRASTLVASGAVPRFGNTDVAIISTAPTTIPMSAMLKAGQCQPQR